MAIAPIAEVLRNRGGAHASARESKQFAVTEGMERAWSHAMLALVGRASSASMVVAACTSAPARGPTLGQDLVSATRDDDRMLRSGITTCRWFTRPGSELQ